MLFDRRIKEPNPLRLLAQDPYAFGICTKETDFSVEVQELNVEKNYLILRKRIDGSVGYICIFERGSLTIEEMRSIYAEFRNLVLRLTNSNFREVELVLICKHYDAEVLESISEYNSTYTHRVPIKLILNEY